jgi:hypothetical protein
MAASLQPGLLQLFSVPRGTSWPSLPPAGTTTGPGFVGCTYIIWLPLVLPAIVAKHSQQLSVLHKCMLLETLLFAEWLLLLA